MIQFEDHILIFQDYLQSQRQECILRFKVFLKSGKKQNLRFVLFNKAARQRCRAGYDLSKQV